MSLPWYHSVAGHLPLDQGDIVLDCPVSRWKRGSLDLREGGDAIGMLKAAIELVQLDVVVMTQTCDLHENKVNYVILCPAYRLEVYREAWEGEQKAHAQNPTQKSWASFVDRVITGRIWNLSMLNMEDGADYHADFRLVDFHEVLSLPRDFLESWLAKEGNQRLRLAPPYREHLSQAFARFFMRVGLPSPISKDW